MNYVQVHTSIYPSYNYLAAENAFLKQDIEYKNAVISDQQQKVANLNKDIEHLSQANVKLKQERDKFQSDSDRWRIMKNIIRTQGNDKQAYDVQKIVDKDLELERRRNPRMERCVGLSSRASQDSSSP